MIIANTPTPPPPGKGGDHTFSPEMPPFFPPKGGGPGKKGQSYVSILSAEQNKRFLSSKDCESAQRWQHRFSFASTHSFGLQKGLYKKMVAFSTRRLEFHPG
jgi:hypothetical protein